jgi:hypothetical protein
MNPVDRGPPAAPSGGPPSRAGFVSVMAAVFASFLGIRRKTSGERDMVTIKLAHVVIAGVVGAAIFVALLVLLVTFITRQ